MKVRLFGREYKIKGHGNTKHVENLAAFINAKAEEIKSRTKVISTLDLVILTLLNITDEMLQREGLQERRVKDAEDKAD